MARQALLIIDMQQGVLAGPAHDLPGVLARINALASRVRAAGGPVIFVQHDGEAGHVLHPSQPGHALHAALDVQAGDAIIPKTACDAFIGTGLADLLAERGVDALIVTGFATDFCVDTTVRSALGRGLPCTVPADAHTTLDRPYLDAAKVVEHHNFVWANLYSPAGAAQVVAAATIR
jgi:nicotinamidase-related amidase